MKFFLLLLFVLSNLLAGFFPENSIPNGFTKTYSGLRGIEVYSSTDSNFIYDPDVNVIIAETGKSSIHFNSLKQHNNQNSFYRYSIKKIFDDLEKKDNNLHIVINGSFFDNASNPSSLSFSTKSNGKILTMLYSENTETKKRRKDLRQLVVFRGTPVILRNLSLKQINGLQNSDEVTDLITGFSPNIDKSKRVTIGRHYIGGIPYKNCNPDINPCAYKFLLFFIAKDKTQSEMDSIVEKWGIQQGSIIMMDGSGSAQYYDGYDFLYGNNGLIAGSEDKRHLPNIISFYSKY
jgi:hypothetical protein